ncbi:uncharacterized protein LOC143032716 isoform X1 [Oratosquilla oratoria]|uniref:uncharacterized protein LOC143032716 isoform X1 n=1 Tax=Oratosquilla oratoria TaxID=337810 RepID=UPI003F776591
MTADLLSHHGMAEDRRFSYPTDDVSSGATPSEAVSKPHMTSQDGVIRINPNSDIGKNLALRRGSSLRIKNDKDKPKRYSISVETLLKNAKSVPSVLRRREGSSTPSPSVESEKSSPSCTLSSSRSLRIPSPRDSSSPFSPSESSSAPNSLNFFPPDINVSSPKTSSSPSALRRHTSVRSSFRKKPSPQPQVAPRLDAETPKETKLTRRTMSTREEKQREYHQFFKRASLRTEDEYSPLNRRSVCEEYDFMGKVMLLGDSGVGKTCLLTRFKSGTYLAGNFIATVSIDFRNKVVTVDGSKVKLQIWDTAGQERFRSVTHAYYRDAHALLLLYDVTSKASFDNTRAWLGEIHEYAQDDVVIMLIGNKCDVSERSIRREDGERLAREYNVAFMETSAKTGLNVDLAFMAVARDLKARKSHHADEKRFNVAEYVRQEARTATCLCSIN